MTEIKLFMDHFYILEDGRVRQFLIVGEQQALLIDTGFEDSGVYQAVREVTDLPVQMLLTHGDRDHTGGLKDFGSCYLNQKDWHLLDSGIEVKDLREGDIFRCGDFCLEVLEIPGHTYGSVAFLDREKKLLLPGDSVQKEGPIFMFGAHRNLDLYIESQKKLCGIADQAVTILPCHHDCPIGPEYMEKNLKDAIDLRAGILKGKKHPFMPCYSYKGRWTEFLYEIPGE